MNRGTPLTNGVPADGASAITADGFTPSTGVKQYEEFTIARVHMVNPITGTSTGVLFKFKVTADAPADASGNCVIPFTPAMIASGQYKNVDALPADNSALTFNV